MLRSIFVILLLVSQSLSSASYLSADERPNIIYVLADDMGFSDIGCFGSEIETPQLDNLAAHGLRYTNFYNCARCCPTRASLLSGLYPHQAGVGWMMEDSGHDGYRGELNRQCVTIAEVLKTAGYRTYMTGKWHVTQKVNPKNEQEKANWPCQRGFDRFYGTIHGAGSFYDPNSLTRDNQLISPYADPEYMPEGGYYYTDAIADHAVRFVNEHHQQTPDEPLFMYVSFTAAHWPMHAREDDIAKYRGNYEQGYEAVRAARYAKMLELGVVSEGSTTLWPMDPNSMETEFFDWDVRNMEVYAAMIDSMDRGIGRIVETLKQTGQFENTLIVYLQDNGGCAEGYGRGDNASSRAEVAPLPPLTSETLQFDMQPKQTRDGFPVRTGKGVMAGPSDTYIGYGKGWATVSNTPFREYKHWTHEGGISTPLIAHWPKGILRHGELESTPGHLVDLMATAVDLAHADYPATFHDGQQVKPMEGKSLMPTFAGTPISREAIYWEHEGNRAVRAGDWKLVAKGADAKWELYNLAKDRSEQVDLVGTHPDRAHELAALWDAYALRADVLPLTPYYKKKTQFKKNKLRFVLKQGDDLPPEQAPYVPERGIQVTATLSDVADGVLVAQGGVSHGWAIYIVEHRIHFATTIAGKRTVVSSEPVSGEGIVDIEWKRNGDLTITWNRTSIVTERLPNLLTVQPADGLQVGSDLAGNVGSYSAPFEFQGEVTNLVIKLSE
jgi:arylsulfatase A-like enzyme